MGILKMTDEIKTRVVAYVQRHGQVTGVTQALPIDISLATIENYLSPKHKRFDPVFRAQVEKAREIYKEVWQAQHPHEDQKLIVMAGNKFRWMVEHGYVKVRRKPAVDKQTKMPIIDPTTGKQALEIVETHEYPGIPEWVYDRIFPKKEMTIESLILMIGFSWTMVTDPDNHFSQELQDHVLFFLSFLKTEGLKRLELKGVKVKSDLGV